MSVTASKGGLALRTLTAQITALIVAAVLLAALLTGGLLIGLSGSTKLGMTPQLKAAAEAARIATITAEARSIPGPDALKSFLAYVQAPGEHITLVDLPPSFSQPPIADTGYPARIRAELAAHWHVVPLAGNPGAIVLALDTHRALAFVVSEHQAAQTIILAQIAIALSIIFLLVLALSIYAVHRVTRPLTAFAAAAQAFGRSPHHGAPLPVTGPLEVARVALALNEMRDRVHRLMDERTRMLAAISHDLRTPLTRLHLRSERVADGQDRQAMLDDIRMIEAMLTETLTYLRDGHSTEDIQLIDLPSFLQTICDEYVDTGHSVAYRGPGRLAFPCRPLALRRALSNIIDNGIKFGTEVTLDLQASAGSPVRIDISDNGPGIPLELYDKVFEPFFKADQARGNGGRGFGLGLAITRDFVVRNGGDISLAPNAPTGLVVSLVLHS